MSCIDPANIEYISQTAVSVCLSGQSLEHLLPGGQTYFMKPQKPGSTPFSTHPFLALGNHHTHYWQGTTRTKSNDPASNNIIMMLLTSTNRLAKREQRCD